jgi:ABC-type polysaccharide/polyol phosphate export permease
VNLREANIFRSKLGALFFCGMNQFMGGLFGAMLNFFEERPVFLRESANKSYFALPYFLGKNVVEFPFQTLFPIIFSAITYYAMGMDSDISKFIFFTLVLVVSNFLGTSFGFFVGTVFDNFSAAQAVTGLVINLPMMFNGVFANLNSFPSYLKWISYISVFRYQIECLAYNEFEGKTPSPFDPVPWEDMYGYTIGKWESFFILLGTGIVFRFFAYLALRANQKRVA